MNRSNRRKGYSTTELLICTAAAATLMAGMASAVVVSTKSLTIGDTGTGARSISAEVQRELMSDLQHATGFTERTATAVTMIVPDRTGDGHPDKLRYAWSGVAGDPLTLQVNGGTAQNLATNVRQFQLKYATKMLTAPVVPDEAPTQTLRVLFVSGGVYTAPTFLQQLDGQTGTVAATASEFPKIALFSSWGFMVNLISPLHPSSVWTSALGNNDVIFVSSEPAVFTAMALITPATIGVVNENPLFSDALGFCVGTGSTTTSTMIVGDVTHYVTQGSTPLQQVALFNSAQAVPSYSLTMSPDASILGTNPVDFKVSCSTIAAGKRSAQLTAVPARRLQLPWAAAPFDATTLTAAGQTALQLAVQWGAGMGPDGNPSLQHMGDDKPANSGYYYLMSTKWEASSVTLASNGELIELSAYVNGLLLPMKFAIYSDNGGKPGTLLTQTGPLVGGLGWLTGPVPSVKLTPGTYWLAVCFSNDLQEAFYLTNSGYTASEIWNQTYSSGFPNNWGTPKKTWPSTQLLMYGAYIPTP